MSLKDYELFNVLGKGSFATVYKSFDRKNQQDIALKMINKKIMRAKNMVDRVKNEIKIQSQLNHINIVKLYECFEDDNYVYVSLEICHSGELSQYIETHKEYYKGISESQAKLFMRQIFEGVDYLHSNSIIHRDLTKIADFGLSIMLRKPDEKHFTMCGTPNFISPETVNSRAHGLGVDIWSLGCILYTLVCGKPPFDTHSVQTTFSRIVQGDFTIPNYVSIPAQNLILHCLQPDPNKRITARDGLKHPFLKIQTVPICKNRSDFSISNKLYQNNGNNVLNNNIFANNEKTLSKLSTIHEVGESFATNVSTDKRHINNSDNQHDFRMGHQNKNELTRSLKNFDGIFKGESTSPILSSDGSISRKDSGHFSGSSSQTNSYGSGQGLYSNHKNSKKEPNLSQFNQGRTSKFMGSFIQSYLNEMSASYGSHYKEDSGYGRNVEIKINNFLSSFKSQLYDLDKSLVLRNDFDTDFSKLTCSNILTSTAKKEINISRQNHHSKLTPLNTTRLKPIRQRNKNTYLSILMDGSVQLEFYKGVYDDNNQSFMISSAANKNGRQNAKNIVSNIPYKVMLISADGTSSIKISHIKNECEQAHRYKNNHGDFDYASFLNSDTNDMYGKNYHIQSPISACVNEKILEYTLDTLPRTYWKKYELAYKFIELIKSKTPKITLYGPEAKHQLMENMPQDFTTQFYDGSKRILITTNNMKNEKNSQSLQVKLFVNNLMGQTSKPNYIMSKGVKIQSSTRCSDITDKFLQSILILDHKSEMSDVSKNESYNTRGSENLLELQHIAMAHKYVLSVQKCLSEQQLHMLNGTTLSPSEGSFMSTTINSNSPKTIMMKDNETFMFSPFPIVLGLKPTLVTLTSNMNIPNTNNRQFVNLKDKTSYHDDINLNACQLNNNITTRKEYMNTRNRHNELLIPWKHPTKGSIIGSLDDSFLNDSSPRLINDFKSLAKRSQSLDRNRFTNLKKAPTDLTIQIDRKLNGLKGNRNITNDRFHHRPNENILAPAHITSVNSLEKSQKSRSQYVKNAKNSDDNLISCNIPGLCWCLYDDTTKKVTIKFIDDLQMIIDPWENGNTTGSDHIKCIAPANKPSVQSQNIEDCDQSYVSFYTDLKRLDNSKSLPVKFAQKLKYIPDIRRKMQRILLNE